ncbi:helix-turn-helix domain-containing protein [Streptomyces marispadix]|uniref:Helix-turn-helix domain-containing protein n=1 Tax=Streptomyces marispadix TaxID=2922868 RepID=A0ABS9SZD6_9ACTN|nr:helix-turn-helix transcriptional regulator [Streptomyces marispadix]MCH6161640.1 helix-turn-helix domain-containing protein [Streptomyces marispadix]
MSEPGRRPLKPLPQELSGPVREFTEQLRAVYRDRTELNQRELAQALHLTKSPVSRYLNGQEVVPAETFAALCELTGLTPRERQRLGRLRQEAAEAAERERRSAEGDDPRGAAPAAARTEAGTPGGAGASAARVRPAVRARSARPVALLRSPTGLGALAAAVAVCAGAFALVPEISGGSANTDTNMTADRPDDKPSCRTTRVYRVIEDGDILDGRRNDIGDVHADDVFRLDKAPTGRPYRFRDYGHVTGSRTKGYVDQAKLKALGSRCVEEEG